MGLAGTFITELTPSDPSAIRLAVKDLFDTAGVRTTYGSLIFRDHVPDTTAEAVIRLEAAGYASVGKTNLHEFAWGITSENPHYGTVPNPIAPGRIAGGSSGGNAAALAAGLADAAVGTDSGGSVRIPAACCGIAGFKPSFGLVPAEGCFPLAPSFDHVGPMTRDVRGCVDMLRALAAGFEPAALDALRDLRVGVAWTARADPLVGARVEAASERFAQRAAVDLPVPDRVYPAFQREVADVHRDLFSRHRDLYGDNVAHKLELALPVTEAQAATAAEARALYADAMARAAAPFDLLVTPTIPMVAPPVGIGDLALRVRMIEFTFPFNATGWPALALPCGPAEDGLPASLQLVGRPGDDALVLAAGLLLEDALAPSLQN